MVRYGHSVTLPYDINKCYDAVISYFPQQGFCVKVPNKPIFIIFERGDNWTGHNLQTIKSTLTVQLTNTSVGTTIACEYEISGMLWDSAKYPQAIKMEVEGIYSQFQLTSSSGTSSSDKDRKCVKCKKQIPWDANICPYCGYNYQQIGKEANEQMGIIVDTKFCPYCGIKNPADFNYCGNCKKPLPGGVK